MPRRAPRPAATSHRLLEPAQHRCWDYAGSLWVAYHSHRTVTTLEGLLALTLVVRTCPNRACVRYHRPYRPEAEGSLALPQGEFGLDVIALVGSLRYRQERSVPEIHRALRERGGAIAERTVTHLLYRYDELVALHVADHTRLQETWEHLKRTIRRYAAGGVRFLVVFWDHGPWHLAHRLARLVARYNRHAKRPGRLRVLLFLLPIKAPWLMPLEAIFGQTKRAIGPLERESLPSSLCASWRTKV